MDSPCESSFFCLCSWLQFSGQKSESWRNSTAFDEDSHGRMTGLQLRRLAHQKTTSPANQYRFRLRFRPPYQWESMLAFLAARATPGVEAVEMGRYRRSISLNGTAGYFEVSLDGKRESLSVHIQFEDSRALFLIIERIRRMFDLSADWQAIAARLITDPALVARVEAAPGLRVPGCWNGFELATRAVLGQQITVKGATVFRHRWPYSSFPLPGNSCRRQPFRRRVNERALQDD